SEDRENDIYVSSGNLNTALNGDRVKVRSWKARGRRRAEGEVVEVLERATEHFIGTIWYHSNHAMVLPDGEKVPDVKVPLKKTLDAKDGEKVVVKVNRWAEGSGGHSDGEVTSVLGKPGTSDIEMKGILINHGFQLEFPKKVLEESERLNDDITEEEVARRRDMRQITTFTIDPETAKDFDDALSIEYLDKGECEIGIHIADVAYYVRPGSALDEEAFERSTSVYLVDRVLPMLPERLSNELCSLRPNEDKLTFSAVFRFDKNGKVIDQWFGRTVIHSDRRFTYEDAQEVLDAGEGPFIEELRLLNKYAKVMRERRFQKGAINFETDEVKFRLDEEGVPISVYVKDRKDAHMLIEDFMLLANRRVAQYIQAKGKQKEIPFIYRIHDEPDPEKVEEFARFAAEMGYKIDRSSPQAIARSYNRLIEAARSEARLKVLEPLAIRTMAKAVYSVDNIGHYGLGFESYTHFTSPIRRYSDVLAHRILERNLPANRPPFRTEKEKLEQKCLHISMQERKAVSAERESVKYKQVEFIQKHLGEVFPGFVSGIIESGLFVELEDNRCEGMISFDTMDEYYELQEGGLKVKGRKSGKEIKMGDRLLVQIVKTDLSRRQIDMVFADDSA
ncbi:MAG: ribonuclease R, partial [Saprospiraceae bacterium]|nr:ribonuclease R [Saprospiraceae bacterium]